MLATTGLQRLTLDLAAAVGSMGLHSAAFGKPELIAVPAREAERIFQGYAKAKPNKDDAYAAARAFLREQKLDAWQQDLIASAISDPVREQGGATVLGSPRFTELLATYEEEANRGDLWRLTWHGLLYSYFNFDPSSVKDQASQRGWDALRRFLERTWPLIDRQADSALVPDWIGVLRLELEVLTGSPADKYARAYLQGDSTATDQLAADLGIAPSSWFWHALVLGAVSRATSDSDAEFRRLVPRLLDLVGSKPVFRDEALEVILVRYHACKGAPQDERLRDYVCDPTVWKNPKLKQAGIATAWNRVPDPVWRMVLDWVNGQNLKDFFDILAARNKADEGRLAFWSKYLKQISWTRLVFGADTMVLKRTHPGIRDLIAREEGAYAQLSGKREVDAFMAQIGNYLIIEFSKKPNACYVYKCDELPFEPYARHYDGGTSDLAAGYRDNQTCLARIVHRSGWELRAAAELKSLGITPDEPDRRQRSSAKAESAAEIWGRLAQESEAGGQQSGPDMKKLENLMERFRRATVDDKRKGAAGGRLWVNDPLQRESLGTELSAMGFRWANSKQAWYFPETK